MPYALTRSEVASITDVEAAFSTERLLPKYNDVPQEFKEGNIYTELAAAVFYGTPVPGGTMAPNEGFADEAIAKDMQRCIRAHLASWGPKHEHKIAGVGYMLSKIVTITPDQVSS